MPETSDKVQIVITLEEVRGGYAAKDGNGDIIAVGKKRMIITVLKEYLTEQLPK